MEIEIKTNKQIAYSLHSCNQRVSKCSWCSTCHKITTNRHLLHSGNFSFDFLSPEEKLRRTMTCLSGSNISPSRLVYSPVCIIIPHAHVLKFQVLSLSTEVSSWLMRYKITRRDGRNHDLHENLCIWYKSHAKTIYGQSTQTADLQVKSFTHNTRRWIDVYRTGHSFASTLFWRGWRRLLGKTYRNTLVC